MSDYTPTTADVRRVYCTTEDMIGYETFGAAERAEFDRWLAKYTAEKRAEWEAERCAEDEATRRQIDGLANDYYEAIIRAERAEQDETEWEYGSEGAEGTEDPDPRPLADDNAYWPESLEGVREPNAEQAAQIVAKWNEGDPGSARLIRRRKAGPWLPVPGPVRVSDSPVRDSDSEESEGKA